MTLFHLLFNSKHLDAWISGFSGIFGAILGSLVTISYTAYYNKKTKNIERKEKLATSAFSLWHKLNLIYSTSKSFKYTLSEYFKNSGNDENYFLTVMPIHFSGGSIEFSTDELWMAYQITGSELSQNLNCLDSDFNGCVDYMNLYANNREKIFNKLEEFSHAIPSTTKETAVIYKMTEEQKEIMGPDFKGLNKQILEIYDLIKKTEKKAWISMKLLIETPKNPLGDKVEVRIPDLDGKEVTLRPKQ